MAASGLATGKDNSNDDRGYSISSEDYESMGAAGVIAVPFHFPLPLPLLLDSLFSSFTEFPLPLTVLLFLLLLSLYLSVPTLGA